MYLKNTLRDTSQSAPLENQDSRTSSATASSTAALISSSEHVVRADPSHEKWTRTTQS